MRHKIWFGFLSSLLLFNSCYKTPEYPDTPAIEFDSYTVAQPYTVGDPGYIRINFTDGGGDFGRLDNSTVDSSCFITNSIFHTTLKYVIPVIPKNGTSDNISGTIDIDLKSVLDSLGCEGILYQYDYPFDTVSYEIVVKDRSGHYSNSITTPPLIFKCRN